MTTIVNDVSDVGIYNIVADQGTTFIRDITYKNSSGVTYSLGTNAYARMKVRKSYPPTAYKAAYRDAPVLTLGYISTATISIANPAVITANSHGLMDNDIVNFTTAGTLPAAITANTNYYVKYVDTNTFQISSTKGGTAISTSGNTQSGTHYLSKGLNVSGGNVGIKIGSEYMSTVTAGIYDYDLEVTLGTGTTVPSAVSGDVIKIIRGLFEVRQEITY